MNHIKSLFITGSIGFAVTAVFHIVMVALLSASSMIIWLPLYLSFATFMLIGLPKKHRW